MSAPRPGYRISSKLDSPSCAKNLTLRALVGLRAGAVDAAGTRGSLSEWSVQLATRLPELQ
jgi:hypothetical protein